MTIRRLLLSTTTLTVALAAAPVDAAPTRAPTPREGSAKAKTKAKTPAEPETPPPPAELSEAAKVDAGLREWSAGNWVGVRAALEHLVAGRFADPLLEETALRYLADATLLDDSLDPQIRSQLATGYISRLFDADPEWRPPPDTHGQPLYDLYNQLRERYERAKLDECRAERASCAADLDELTVRHTRLDGEHEALRRAFGEQEVEVREKIARNRAIALLPFGVGQFYNGRRGLGAGFLAGEVVAGGVGLGLLIFRNTQCTRTAGFAPESVQCVASDSDALLARRNAETAFGLTFIGLLVVDVLVAQLTFEPYATVKTERVRRSDLEAEAEAEAESGAPRERPGRRQSSRRLRDNLGARPAPLLLPGGGGAAMTLRF